MQLDYIESHATNPELPFVKESVNSYKFTRNLSAEEIINTAKYLLSERVKKETYLKNPQNCIDYLVTKMGAYESEIFAVIFLDVKNGIIALEEISIGTINQAPVYPREIVKKALLHNAASVILAHNHPSGVTEPSCGDETVTRMVKEALNLVDINVLDHIIIAGGDYFSFAEGEIL